jgi:hypothetical protein
MTVVYNIILVDDTVCMPPLYALKTVIAAAAHNFRNAIRTKKNQIRKRSITKDRIEVASQIILI